MASLSLTDLADRVLTRAAERRAAGRYVLGIAGPPGVGKSTLAEGLRDAINVRTGSSTAEVAPMDGFHLDNATLAAAGRLAQKGAPDTFDAAGFVEHLARLRASRPGQDIAWPTFDRSTDASVLGGAVFRAETIVITEGNYLLSTGRSGDWSAVAGLLDESWYLDGDRATRTARLIRRHLDGGRTEANARAKVFDSDLVNARSVEGDRVRADTILWESGNVYLTRHA